MLRSSKHRPSSRLAGMATQRSTRGRPRLFDEDAAVDSALDLFWQHGYRATTTRELESALGMRQPSIYNAFGSKQALLLRAIDRYEGLVEDELLGTLDASDDGHAAIIAFFQELCTWIAENRYRGCLVVNLMVGETGDDTIDERSRAYRAKILAAFAKALRRTGAPEPVVTNRANLLLAAVLGLHLTARTAERTQEVPAMVDGICSQVADWRSSP